ncbi:MAG: nitrate- and nitrite sensing domain-containing protein [Xanthobacteraceae bacterium]|nr:nitrate- and nitrite sensing domain-containing protein [Xanthobacteraceae bacterium]
MLKLSNIRIPVRIAIVGLLPLVAFVFFAGKDLLEKRSIVSSVDAVAAVTQAAPLISALVHDLQTERGSSAGFINSKGKAFAAVVRDQRPLTDKTLQAWNKRSSEYLNSKAGTQFARNLDDAKSKLAELDSVRAGVDAFSIDASKVTAFYTAAIASLITVIDAMSEMTEDARIMRQATALSSLVRRKEFAGQGRALGAVGFSSGQFPPQVYQEFMRRQVLDEAYSTFFRRNATPAQIDYVNDALSGAVEDTMTQMRQLAANSPFNNNMSSVSGQQWFDAATKYIDSLKRAEDRLVSDFTATVQAIADEASWKFWSLLALFLGLLGITGVVTAAIALSITRPIGKLVATMQMLAKGHHDIEVPVADRGDEIGHIGKAVLTFRVAAAEKHRLETETADRQKAAEMERQRSEAARTAATAAQVKLVVDALGGGLEQLATGVLTHRITNEFADEYEKVRNDFNAAIAQLQETVGAIAASVREVSNAAAEISTSTTDLSQRTEEQAASLEQTSAAMEEISATVKQNAENAQKASQFATGTREVADRGGEVVAEAVKAMSRIEQSSRKISDIIGVIDEIARQTNLLALNAAVEAARAGEAGRGFAVVASEVRSLAQRSSQAAKDIKDLITNSSDQVQEGVELVNRAGTSLNEILASIKKVADIVSNIAAASAEQATGLEQVGKALTQMDEVTQQNSALVEENAATAKTLEHQARAMDERVAFFRIAGAGAAKAVVGAHVEPKAQPMAAAGRSRAPAATPAPAPKRAPVATPRRSAAAANAGGGPVGRMQTALATAIHDDPEWKEF